MNQNKTANFTTITTHKIQGGQYNSLVTFEVQDGKDIVRMRSYFNADENKYAESFNINPPEALEKDWVIDANTWYDIKVGREIYKYMMRDETGNPEYPNFRPFLPVP